MTGPGSRTRQLVRAAFVWLALAWLTVAIANLLFPAVGLPVSAIRAVVVALAIGLVIVLALAWRAATRAARRERTLALEAGRARTARRLDQAGVVLVLAALSLSLLHQFLQPYAERRAAAAPAPAVVAAPAVPVDPHSIAVLPFANHSPDPGDAYFADGLAEELLNVLARIDGLKVTSRSSSFTFRDRPAGAREIAARLGVAYLLEGSVRRQGDDVRITVQLVDAATEQQRWSSSYDRRLSDIFQVQQEISQAVADALAETLGGRQVQVAPSTTDLQAYGEYLRGRQLFVQRGANLPAARGLLEQAVARDPRFADAWAALAGTWYVWRSYAPEPEGIDTRRRAEESVATALALDPAHPGALAVAARLAADRGERLIEAELIGKALAREPSNANTWLWKGLGEYEAGHVRAAQASFARALELDPLSGLHQGWVAITSDGDEAGTRASLAEAHALGWRGPSSRALFMRIHAAGEDAGPAYLAWLHDDDTLPEAQRTLARELAPALADPARRDDARRRLRAANEAMPDLDWTLLLQVFGLTDDAIEEALRHRDDAQTLRLNVWMPGFATFRAHPRFAEWARREGLFDYWRKFGPPDGCTLAGDDAAPVLACD